jgi:superfamily II DNA/RNA helicase
MSVDREAPGRLYLGVMAQGHTPVTANVHTSAALLQAPISADPGSAPGDHFWTLVAYHNSLRELGKTTTLARDDTPARIEVIEPVDERRRAPINVVEITSNVAAAQIPERLAELGLVRTEAGAIDLAACTNMLSVGVDIPRLGLMMVVGQPKSTSEYIQATSRVGRTFPGLVVTLYSSAKARDRSHYESFRAYHGALYAAVEGVSVTPTSPRARERALHAALVVIARHALGLGPDASADNFSRNDADVQRALSALASRLTEADPGERDDVLADLERLASDWNGRVAAAHAAQERLRYRRSGNAGHALLKDFDSTERGKSWPTLHSMRGVDAETKINVARRS